ncbi:MAG: YnbE family lipoprotein [Lentisphaerae bacterium]|nr:YnbE family lipoprotein [Lentisphaerota bacterium]MCP4099803.1 YnbE family lipoprotein [Lentisphaerota bacterium]
MGLLLCGCTQHKIESKSEVDVKPIEIKPIHITIDINVKVDRALDNFFGDLDQEADQPKTTDTEKTTK